VDKVAEATGVKDSMVLCERGTTFGYNNLVVDMLAFDEMKKLGVPVTMDATHAAQLPGADPRTQGASTGGRREAVPTLARSAVAAGADGIFLEFHPRPDDALCDPLCCLDLKNAKGLLTSLKAIRSAI
jgi:2-dehydro-3-deoxyphosphooctonate aldolase (KDO 8-P synthase)